MPLALHQYTSLGETQTAMTACPHPILMFIVRQQTLVTIIIKKGAKEDVR